MSDKKFKPELTAVRKSLLSFIQDFKGTNYQENVLELLNDNELTEILTEFCSKLERYHWANTGAKQTIAAVVNINVIDTNGRPIAPSA